MYLFEYVLYDYNEETMLKLDEKDFVGKGCHKLTYLHPKDKTKCIKIIYNSEGNIDIRRELRYRAHRQEKGLTSTILPAYYGEVETDKGHGYIFEHLCDYDGNTSLTLMDYIDNLDAFEQDLDQLIVLMLELKEHLFADKIISMGITPENIVIQKNSPTEKRIYLITDLGVSELIPFVLWFDFLGMKKIQRKYNKMVYDFIDRWDSAPMRKLVKALEA